MGFVACFAMPLLLGVPLVLMDPIDWVRRPSLLYEAIARFGGTVCYLPNFAFAVLAAHPPTVSLASMRAWISCSEPVYPDTMQRFMDTTATPAEKLAVSYAMAENIFAVTYGPYRALEVGERVYASCGRPIPGTEIAIRDDEIHVRSAYSIRSYLGVPSFLDETGFFATGDRGFLVGDELVVSGRVRDILNISGRKTMLNDIDQVVNRILPSGAGRAAALALDDEKLGTQRLLILAEHEPFADAPDLAATKTDLAAALEQEAFDFAFVPPRFITKSSSGKINRAATLDDWLRLKEAAPMEREAEPLRSALARHFTHMPENVPIDTLFDSLGGMVLRGLLADRGLAWQPRATLAELIVADESRVSGTASEERPVSIAITGDVRLYRWLDDQALARLADTLGRDVRVEHFCLRVRCLEQQALPRCQ